MLRLVPDCLSYGIIDQTYCMVFLIFLVTQGIISVSPFMGFSNIGASMSFLLSARILLAVFFSRKEADYSFL